MTPIRIITDQSILYFSDPSNSYLISKEKNYVFFRPKGKFVIVGFLQHIESSETTIPTLVQEAIANDIGVVYVCDKLPENPIVHPNIVYLKVQWAWLIHTLFFNPLLFHGVFGNGAMTRLVKAFSCFTQYKIPILDSLSDIKDMSKQHEETTGNILCEISGGIGDHLLCIPTFKTLVAQGKKVHLLINKHRQVCFNNLDYIHKYYYRKEEIDVSQFDNIHWLNFGQVLNDYRRELNQQNRIFAVANLCSLDKSELVTDIPEIILTEEEKLFGKNLVEGHKKPLFFGFDSARSDSKIPLNLTQDTINKLNNLGFSVFTSSLKSITLEGCTNLTGQLNERQLFSVINAVDAVLTIDTSFLHIAGALKKKLYVLMNYFNPDWRMSTYKNCKAYTPMVDCYPCASGWYKAVADRRCNFGHSCYVNFDWGQIFRDLKNEC